MPPGDRGRARVCPSGLLRSGGGEFTGPRCPRVREGQVGNNKVNRRAFTKASVAAGAAAVALGRLGAETPAAKSPAAGAAAPAGSPGAAPHGWREGTTIPGEYYVDPKHYENDERALAERFWLLVDHQSRIPKPGDYFVFEYGRGENVIILRNDSGGISAFHNVC